MNTYRFRSTVYRYRVYGAGRIGIAVAYDLIKYCSAKQVDIIEPDEKVARSASKRLRKLLGRDARLCSLFTVDPGRQCHVIISCAPYIANLKITQIALMMDVPMIDLGGNPDTVAEQEHLTNGHDTLIVPECGISPGISNILAVGLASEGYLNLNICCGGVPSTRPDNGFVHKIVFSPEGLLSEYMGKAPAILDGRIHFIDALGTISNAGLWEASPTSNNSPQVAHTLLNKGVTNYTYMTLRYPGHWAAYKSLAHSLQNDKDAILSYLKHKQDIQYDPNTDSDILVLSVNGLRNMHAGSDAHSYTFCFKADPKTRFSAMELTTAWGATIVAYYIALHGQTRTLPKGFNTPERFMDYRYVLRVLDKKAGLVESGNY